MLIKKWLWLKKSFLRGGLKNTINKNTKLIFRISLTLKMTKNKFISFTTRPLESTNLSLNFSKANRNLWPLNSITPSKMISDLLLHIWHPNQISTYYHPLPRPRDSIGIQVPVFCRRQWSTTSRSTQAKTKILLKKWSICQVQPQSTPQTKI